MTNLIGTIAFVVVTNWSTVSVEKPICHTIGCKEVHYEMIYQVGTVVTNTALNMIWKGKERQIVLESSEPFYVTRVGKVQVVNTNVPLLITKPKK